MKAEIKTRVEYIKESNDYKRCRTVHTVITDEGEAETEKRLDSLIKQLMQDGYYVRAVEKERVYK